ncbi:MAG: extracellular solute-binding protein, partial [Verrucomicrobiota bacterium]
APPDFEWGVAPFPSADPARFRNITQVESDVLVIPAGAKHPKEAFEFIQYVNSQKPMEKLCLGQRKFTPFRECSAEFLKHHPNPWISKFIELSKSPNAKYVPRLTTWTEYKSEMNNAVSRIWAGKIGAKKALLDVQQREQQDFDRHQARWERMSSTLTREWDRE